MVNKMVELGHRDYIPFIGKGIDVIQNQLRCSRQEADVVRGYTQLCQKYARIVDVVISGSRMTLTVKEKFPLSPSAIPATAAMSVSPTFNYTLICFVRSSGILLHFAKIHTQSKVTIPPECVQLPCNVAQDDIKVSLLCETVGLDYDYGKLISNRNDTSNPNDTNNTPNKNRRGNKEATMDGNSKPRVAAKGRIIPLIKKQTTLQNFGIFEVKKSPQTHLSQRTNADMTKCFPSSAAIHSTGQNISAPKVQYRMAQQKRYDEQLNIVETDTIPLVPSTKNHIRNEAHGVQMKHVKRIKRVSPSTVCIQTNDLAILPVSNSVSENTALDQPYENTPFLTNNSPIFFNKRRRFKS